MIYKKIRLNLLCLIEYLSVLLFFKMDRYGYGGPVGVFNTSLSKKIFLFFPSWLLDMFEFLITCHMVDSYSARGVTSDNSE